MSKSEPEFGAKAPAVRSASLLDQVRDAVSRLRTAEPELFQKPSSDDSLAERVASVLAEDESGTAFGEESFALWRRLAGQARRALQFAYEEAERVGSGMLSPEHLALGLLYDDSTVASSLLDRMGKHVSEIRNELQRQVVWGDLRLGGEIPLSAQTKQVIDHAYDEARQLNDQYIGTEHLLIGLLREGATQAAYVFSLFEVGTDNSRASLQVLREDQSQETVETGLSLPQPEPKMPPVLVRDPRFGDIGEARSGIHGRIEVTLDAATFVELVAVYRSHDAYGYRALVEGNQTMFLIPEGTQLKRLVPPPDGHPATAAGGYYIRVMSGEYAAYAGWVAANHFFRIGPDDTPFPPELA